MNTRAGSLLALGAAASIAGCLNSSFVRNDGPVAAQGVTVSLVGQRCEYSPDFNEAEEGGAYPNRLDLGIRMTVANATSDTITIQPANMRLVAGSAKDAPVGAPASVSVAAGATASIDVRFQHRGDLGCDASLSLALDGAVLDGSRSVTLRAIGFVPARSES